ncbi:MAG TPA: hypothetical protein VEQ34_10145, partial [Pyrinomonadaceae bacterium]|nr:hypothetical protein [Pyrinomonadaceae bacterium]
DTFPANSGNPFRQIKDHILLPFADEIERADEAATALLKPELLREIVNLIPAEWLGDAAEKLREDYFNFLTARLETPREFVKEALDARRNLPV